MRGPVERYPLLHKTLLLCGAAALLGAVLVIGPLVGVASGDPSTPGTPTPGETSVPPSQPVAALDDAAWREIYASSPSGEALDGDREALLNAVRTGQRIRVRWTSFHGPLVGACRGPTVDDQGRVDCVAEAWCELETQGVPRDHGHRARVTSLGGASSIVLARRGDEVRILGAEGTTSARWYTSPSAE